MTEPDAPRGNGTDDEVAIEAQPLRLIFRWVGDRWSHVIEVAGRRLASSVEWDAILGEPTRVVSPAFQQLNRQSSAGRDQALLVGQWGSHHFSGVFQVERTPTNVTLEVDVATRSRGVLESLAATYRVHLASGDLVDAGPDGVSWHPGPSNGRLRLEPLPSGTSTPRVSLAEAGRGETSVQVEASVLAGESTRRLAYRWEWSNPSPTAIL
ncbi:MAG: hypothetical protein AB7I30_02360 [Isosphaeraceae bacterium]